MDNQRTQSAAHDRGHSAESPWQMPLSGWKDVAARTWKESSSDNVGLVAAGVAFYGFIALVPMLGAIVITYGLVANPQTVVSHFQSMAGVLPSDVATIVRDQLMNAVEGSGSKKGFGLLLALAIALWGARNAAGSIITALNIAYEEAEKRSFLKVTLITLAMTLGAVLVALLAIGATTVLSLLHHLLPSSGPVAIAFWKILTYVLLAAAAAAAIATLYRYAPSREEAEWSWITPGSAFATIAWLLLTVGFGFYVANFGNYDQTYGSLGAIVVLLTWMYLSAYVLLFGAELNSELEHQTAHDTTAGGDQPMGERGAWSADNVAGQGNDHANDSSFGGGPGGGDEPSRAEPEQDRAAVAPKPEPRKPKRAASMSASHRSGSRLASAAILVAVAGLALVRRPDTKTG